jgi:hypothetical protein
VKSRIHARCLRAPSLAPQIEPTCKPAPRRDRIALGLNNRDRTPELGHVRIEGEGSSAVITLSPAEQGRVPPGHPRRSSDGRRARTRDPATIGQPCLGDGADV